MALNPYVRVENFFKYKIKTNSIDIDSEFNNIVEFLNNDILSTINDLVANQFQADANPALFNSFMVNAGDGTIKWDFINSDSFKYNGLSLIKFERGEPNSVLVFGMDNEYNYEAPKADYQVLRSIMGDSPFWDFIIGDCFEDRVIEGSHITPKTITMRNLDGIEFFPLDNSIPVEKFKENCVTSNNLVDVDSGEDELNIGLTFDRLAPNVQAVFSTMITSNMMPNDYISNYFGTIFSGINEYSDLTRAEYLRIIDLEATVFDVRCFGVFDQLNVKSFSIDNVAFNSIEANRLQYIKDGNYFPRDFDLLHDGSILPEHLTPQLRTMLDL